MIILLTILLAADAPVVARKPQSLVQQLGHPEYQVRERANRILKARIDDSIPEIQQGMESNDPEIRWRCQELLKHHATAIQPTNYPWYPWIDNLPKNYPNRKKILKRYKRGDEFTFRSFQLAGEIHLIYAHWDCREATHSFVSDLLKAGKSRKEIVALLDEMAREERFRVERNSQFYGYVLRNLHTVKFKANAADQKWMKERYKRWFQVNQKWLDKRNKGQ